jgi:hypothetical protein
MTDFEVEIYFIAIFLSEICSIYDLDKLAPLVEKPIVLLKKPKLAVPAKDEVEFLDDSTIFNIEIYYF